jgi:hypothetical protein
MSRFLPLRSFPIKVLSLRSPSPPVSKPASAFSFCFFLDRSLAGVGSSRLEISSCSVQGCHLPRSLSLVTVFNQIAISATLFFLSFPLLPLIPTFLMPTFLMPSDGD